MSKLVAVDYEVFGIVQGVFFRKYTQKKAKELGIFGWVKNTSRETVVGQLEGESSKINEMKTWLQRTGSPMSRIDKAQFSNERDIAKLSFKDFKVSG